MRSHLSLLFFLIPVSVAAYSGFVHEVRSPDTLVLTNGRKVRLVGVVSPGNEKDRTVLIRHLRKRLIKKKIEIESDSGLLADARVKAKTVAERRRIAIPAYVFFACDTCGVSSAAPKFRATEIVTVHPLIHLNAWLIEQGHCKADTSGQYSKKGYFLYLESQRAPATKSGPKKKGLP